MKNGVPAGQQRMTEPHLTAWEPCPTPPRWAVLQRQLFEALEEAVEVYVDKYTRQDGTLIYADHWPNGRDGLDDLFEAFYNFPLLYLLGGKTDLLKQSHRHWEAVNRQAAGYGLVSEDYEIGYDQFHQSEGNLFFCLLCAADPLNPRLRERATRFADLFLGMPNYDAELNIIRAFHTGADGPRAGDLYDENIFGDFMQHFGLPFYDLEGIQSFDDVADWNTDPVHDSNRMRMRSAMRARMGEGDAIANVLATCIVTNAYLMTGEESYRSWIETYLGGWWDRAAANGGIPPDNVGLNGHVGDRLNDSWFGAAYGWTWPLGYDYISDFLAVAGMNAALVTGRRDFLEMPGALHDRIFEMGSVVADFREINPPRPDRWVVEAAKHANDPSAFVAPKKHGVQGWFAGYPFHVGPLANSWCTTFDPVDRARLAALEAAEPHPWAATFPFRSKGDDGHERPWLAYLDGRFDTYPEAILEDALRVVTERLEAVRSDHADLTRVHIHHWQNHNPVTTEALVQLTWGGPQHRYNGGAFRTCFRYFDVEADRPGLPPDIAALVGRVDPEGATLSVVNLSRSAARTIRIQGGFYGEHEIVEVTTASGETVPIHGSTFRLTLPKGTSAELRVRLLRLNRKPAFSHP